MQGSWRYINQRKISTNRVANNLLKRYLFGLKKFSFLLKGWCFFQNGCFLFVFFFQKLVRTNEHVMNVDALFCSQY